MIEEATQCQLPSSTCVSTHECEHTQCCVKLCAVECSALGREGSCCVPQAGFKLEILLPLLLEC